MTVTITDPDYFSEVEWMEIISNLLNFRSEFCPNFAPNCPPISFFLSCFVSWEPETTQNSPKIPAISQWTNSKKKGRGRV